MHPPPSTVHLDSAGSSSRNNDTHILHPPPISLISVRRPSVVTGIGLPRPNLSHSTVSDHTVRDNGITTTTQSGLRNETSCDSRTGEDDGNFKQNLQIDMKTLVGDAVGNMSISPTSRDIVLAARKGLFIIDLEAPFEIPRFLPQGGTWDVADVQWNPHPSHAELIVSTSSERLLIWNLLIVGKTAIESILQAHYRAITDINWHTFDPNIVCSTGIDSWIWAWDIRTTQKPAFGLCAFNGGGTQVKWNRQDENILASSHLDEVLVWDRRKGSVPLSQFPAHDAKIYGIDWSRTDKNKIITCSLDKSVKVWDVSKFVPRAKFEPVLTFNTSRPVWRARDLPFGRGVLSLPQRGETALGMWSYDHPSAPVETFEGHTDVVKEFVWRNRGGMSQAHDSDTFQLITWSKDKTLRFWRVNREMMANVGASPDTSPHTPRRINSVDMFSFRSPPEGTRVLPTLSAPRGHRSILAEVRAPLPNSSSINPVLLPHYGSALRANREKEKNKRSRSPVNDHGSLNRSLSAGSSLSRAHGQNTGSIQLERRATGTMSKGSKGGKSTKMEPSTWLSGFRADSAGPSRKSSGSRPPSQTDRDSGTGTDSGKRNRSESYGQEDTTRGHDSGAALLDEINSVILKLTPSKVKLEKHGLTKDRTCTFGLHGPWGESHNINVFIRVTFAFPREYPYAKAPLGAPSVDIERSPLISTKKRAYMQQKLRVIRETQRPCLEACLRFLMFADGVHTSTATETDSGTSDDDDDNVQINNMKNKKKDFSASMIRDQPNLAEPRSSQGVFGANGQLVCIFRSLLRLVKTPPRDISVAPTLSSREVEPAVPGHLQTPVQLSEAVRRLAVAANDRSFGFGSFDSRERDDAENILRIMNNLLSFSHPKQVRSVTPGTTQEHQQPSQSVVGKYSLLPKQLTTVFIKDRSYIVGAHRAIAEDYVLYPYNPLALCLENARIAHEHARLDHERMFRTLATIMKHGPLNTKSSANKGVTATARKLVEKLHQGLVSMKDIQLLAMFALIVLHSLDDRFSNNTSVSVSMHSTSSLPLPLVSHSSATQDYFNLSRRKDTTNPSSSTSTPRTGGSPSPATQASGTLLPPSSSSKASWSSIFTTGTMRHLIGDLVRDTGGTDDTTITQQSINKQSNTVGHDLVPKRILSNQESNPAVIRALPLARRNSDVLGGSPKIVVSTHTSRRSERRPTFSQVLTAQPVITVQPAISERRRVLINETIDTSPEPRVEFVSQATRTQLVFHVLAYVEMLHKWQLLHKKAEALKVIHDSIPPQLSIQGFSPEPLHIATPGTCPTCGVVTSQSRCSQCGEVVRSQPVYCTVCRLPIRGLSRQCLICCHATHMQCWSNRRFQLAVCPSGCGCQCNFGGANDNDVLDS